MLVFRVKVFVTNLTWALVLVNSTVVEIFYQDFPNPPFKSPNFLIFYSSLIQS